MRRRVWLQVPIVVVVLWVGISLLRVAQYDRAYDALRAGESRSDVIATFGSPHAVRGLTEIWWDGRLLRQGTTECGEEYLYYSPLPFSRTIWAIGCDPKGRVISKSRFVP